MTQPFHPLAGLRVADFGLLTAGANTSAMLADLGADVIKIESGAFVDPFRRWLVNGTGEWWNESPQFHFTNRNKRGISVNLKNDRGREIVFDLLRRCDVLVENFSRGVLDRMGMGYAEVSAANPKLVYVSITSQGETGPYLHHRTYGSTLDAMGGIAALTGYPDGGPLISGGDVNYPDQVVSLLATGCVLAAVREARKTGKGAHVDISQREVVSFLLGEEIVSASADPGRAATRQGNMEAGLTLQQCFLAADGKWVAVTVRDADAEKGLRPLIGEGALADELAAWVGSRDAGEASRQLRGAGVAAAPSNTGADMLATPGLLGESVAWADGGMMLKGMPYSFDGSSFVVERAAPSLGADTHEVLISLLGIDPAEIDRLDAQGVLSNTPVGAT